jgi:putative flippase GtrA
VIDRRLATRFLRYALGSGVATAVSAVVFALVFRFLGAGPVIASVSAFVAGFVVNFSAGRFWAWQRKARPGLGRDAVSFAIVAIVTALAAVGVTSATNALMGDADPNTRAIVVEASYYATYAVLFVAKFVVLDRLVFRSRHQVPNTTRV